MRTNTTPSSISSIYLSVALLVLISVNEKTHAMFIEGKTLKNTGRRSIDYDRKPYVPSRCNTWGQACYGGFGKRSYSKIKRDSLEESIDQNHIESEIPTNDELFYAFPNEEFRELLDQRYIRIRKDSQRFNSSPFLSLINQVIAFHNRPHHRINSDFTNK